jgi:hypothetical protein
VSAALAVVALAVLYANARVWLNMPADLPIAIPLFETVWAGTLLIASVATYRLSNRGRLALAFSVGIAAAYFIALVVASTFVLRGSGWGRFYVSIGAFGALLALSLLIFLVLPSTRRTTSAARAGAA